MTAKEGLTDGFNESMSDEVESTPKIIEKQIPAEHRKYIMELLGEGILPLYIAEIFIEVYPQYLEQAESAGHDKASLLNALKNRIRDLRRSPNYTSAGVSEATETGIMQLLNPETLPTVINHHFDPNILEEVRQIVYSTIHNFEQSEEYDAHLKRAEKTARLLSVLDNISYKRMSLKHKLDKEIFVKLVLLQAKEDAKEDTGKVLPKPSTFPEKRTFRLQEPVNREHEEE